MANDLQEKSKYCLNCKVKPCSLKGCPLNNQIPLFIEKIKEENYEEAYKILQETTVLPAVCGKICPHKKQCEGSCVRGIKSVPVSIGEMESFVGEYALEHNLKINKNTNEFLSKKKVAIVGGGPAGLTCAAFLAKQGVDVTIFEKYNYLGGLLVHGIPDFRLSKNIVEKTIQKIIDLGIKIEYNKALGKNLNLQDLKKQYNIVVLAFGANKTRKTGLPGENLNGVYGGNELLEYKLHPNYEGKIVLINGGGNVAMDTARTIKRLGAQKVIVVYRRSKNEMPAEEKEVESAIAEGIEILFQTNIVKINGNNKVEEVELINTELVKKENEQRMVPINIQGSNYEIKADYVIMAVGSEPEQFIEQLGLELTKWKTIKVDEKNITSDQKIYAIGDLAGEKQTVAWAARSGRNTAENIIKYFLEEG